MKATFKVLGIILLVLVVLCALFVGFSCLCKALGWIPTFTEWVVDKLGLTFVGKL